MIITPTKFCVFTALLRRLSRKIVQQGFDHRLSGDRGLYGQGLYFTTDFCKAAKHCNTSDDLGRRCVEGVLTGCKSNSNVARTTLSIVRDAVRARVVH